MKKILLGISTIIIVVTVFSSCQSVSGAQTFAEKFYEAMKINDYSSATALFDQQMLEQYGEEELIKILNQRNNSWGKIYSFSKYGFNTSTKNGITNVSLKFKVESEKGMVYEKIEFIKRGEQYKITGYFFNPDKEKIEKM